MFFAFLFVILVTSQHASSVTIRADFSEKHLAELSNPPTKSAVFERQRDIKTKHPQRTINHIIFSNNLANLQDGFKNSVEQMIQFGKCPNQTGNGNVNNKKCTLNSTLFSDGIVWSTWPNVHSVEPENCYYVRSCNITIGLLGLSNEMKHLFPINTSRDCLTVKECEDPPGVEQLKSGFKSLRSNFSFTIALLSILLHRLMERRIG